MITGILLLYIGLKNGYPALYLIGCWAVILIRALKIFADFCRGVYDAWRENGES
jgi:hypothetical protein